MPGRLRCSAACMGKHLASDPSTLTVVDEHGLPGKRPGPHWVKVNKPNPSAVKREAEEDWR
jgi:hypothetical protein